MIFADRLHIHSRSVMNAIARLVCRKSCLARRIILLRNRAIIACQRIAFTEHKDKVKYALKPLFLSGIILNKNLN